MEGIMLYAPELVQKITFLLSEDYKWKVTILCEDCDYDSLFKLSVNLN